jgi:hypothetical protein
VLTNKYMVRNKVVSPKNGQSEQLSGIEKKENECFLSMNVLHGQSPTPIPALGWIDHQHGYPSLKLALYTL